MSISVVIPYYNNSRDIDRCLKSIENQTIRADEVILIDDFSDDSDILGGIINQYDGILNIKYIRNGQNKNGAYSRNLGMKIAISEYIALLDADDYWSEKHLELSLLTLSSKDADFTYSNINLKKNDTIKKIKVDDVNLLKNAPDIILLTPPQTGSFFFKRKITKSVNFDEKLRRHQDYQFLLDVILKGYKMIYDDVYTSYYCVSGQQLARKLDFSSIFSFWDNYKNNFSLKLLQEYLIRMLCLNMRTVNEKNIEQFMREYSVLSILKGTSFYYLYSLIGDKKNISKKFLFIYFKFRYDIKKIILQLN